MAKRTPKTVEPSKYPKERSLDAYPLYINRHLPFWGNPSWTSSDVWRTVVQSQPMAVVCRETLISLISGLDWAVEPRDSNQRDELKGEIKYYTKFLENTGDYDYTEIIEWVSKDLLDLPFGGAVEVGRKYDSPEGRVIWLELLDGATLYPTNNHDYPVAQYVPQASVTPVYFPSHAINRVYLSPRTRMKDRGWGMAPPEKIYMALELVNRGDYYYANLLLDTPSAGILDLGDMDKESATEWVVAWRELLAGIDPYKVPVIYEHEKPINFVPFTKNPTDLHFNTSMMRYAGILVAGYGMSMSDIGLSMSGNGGETLAGTIRDERRTKRTGVSTLKKKLTYFFNRLLPAELQFRFVDLDDELMVSVGRARLAAATALGALKTNNMITEAEGRMQMMADGLMTISIPEELPKELKDRIDAGQQPNKDKIAERPNMLGRPVSPSSGGWGETTARSIYSKFSRVETLKALNTVFTELQVLSTFDDDLIDKTILERGVNKLVSTFAETLSLDETVSPLSDVVISYLQELEQRKYVLGKANTVEIEQNQINVIRTNTEKFLKTQAFDVLCRSMASNLIVRTLEQLRNNRNIDVFDIEIPIEQSISDVIEYITNEIDGIMMETLGLD